MKKHKKYLYNVFKALISEEYNKFYEKQKNSSIHNQRPRFYIFCINLCVWISVGFRFLFSAKKSIFDSFENLTKSLWVSIINTWYK